MKSNIIEIKYIGFPLLAKELEDNANYFNSLALLKKQKKFISKCDCIVLGCTPYNTIKEVILHKLYKDNCTGLIFDQMKFNLIFICSYL